MVHFYEINRTWDTNWKHTYNPSVYIYFLQISLLLYLHVFAQIIRLQNHMGICMSVESTRRVVDQIRKGFDKDILDVKAIIEV